ncbi:MAG TPA: response regulator [Bryobacteraceae bacterium]|nr:response regulator [Bryobacteraceae bacterium]
MAPRTMANETILIVDDAPVSLKLTDILLRKEGYKVHSTTDAEQALSMLYSLHPDMMLVDIQLPGMNGLELTRRVKQDARTRDIVIVALTACAMKGDDDRAFQAGCDGYITKPIETLTLAAKVREYLAHRSAAPALEMEPVENDPRGFPGGITLTPSELESIRRRFLEEGAGHCRQLLGNLEYQLDVASTRRTVRGWIDAAQALDYPVLAILAGEVEKLLREPNPDRVLLCEALSNLNVGFVEPPEAALSPIPAAVEAALKGKSVALIGVADEDAERLMSALERVGAKPRRFDPTDRLSADVIAASHLIVIHVRTATLGTSCLHPLTIAEWKQPVVLMGIRDHMLDLDPSVLPRAVDLLIDGWQPEEALLRFGHALSRVSPVKAPAAAAPVEVPRPVHYGIPMPREITRETEVLLADDDLTVRMVTRTLMQNAGIKCRMACDGNEALQAIRDCRPAAAIIDINMPGMDGYEVLAAVRHEMLPVRVILLTARQQESDITRGFTLGADDYVVKPFNPPELLARVKRFL